MTSVSVSRQGTLSPGLALKIPCLSASLGNLVLHGEQTVDGVALVEGDRVLVKNQTSSIENGIYSVSTGDWSREPDFDGPGDITSGSMVLVIGGTQIGLWQVTTTADPIIPDTTAITFAGVGFTGLLVSGGIVFGSAAGQATQDPTKLFWDHANNRLGIGTNAPAVALDVVGAGKTSGAFTVGTTLQVSGDSSIFGTTSVDVSTKILVRGTGAGVRIGTSGTTGSVEAVDNTGSASFKDLILNGATVSLDIAGTQKVVLTSAGVLSLLIGQLLFPATQNPSADPNTLDDYEEGTFTISLQGATTTTYTQRLAKYTKVGDLVYLRIAVSINAQGDGSQSQLSGFPFSNGGDQTPFATRMLGSATSLVSITASLDTTPLMTMKARTANSASDGTTNVFQAGAQALIAGCHSLN